MNADSRNANHGLKAVALVVGYVSIMMLGASSDAETWVRIGSMLAGTIGAVAAYGIWTETSWMTTAYFAWFLVASIAHGYRDSHVEPVVAKVVFGVAAFVLFWGAVGYYIHRSQSTGVK